MSHFQSRWLAPALLCVLSCNTYAVDGIVLIDQNRALAGNVTPGDAPGFPVTISVPGSYRLSGNLTVPDANTTAILVTADNVTVDLNGFSIIGPTVCVGSPVTSCSPTGSGVGVNAQSQNNVTVVNGTVRGMGGSGIVIFGMGYVEKVHAISNGFIGISVRLGVVSGNMVISNGYVGIDVENGTVSGNLSAGNHSAAIEIHLCPSTVVGNTAVGNGTDFIAGGSGGGPACAVANNSPQ